MTTKVQVSQEEMEKGLKALQLAAGVDSKSRTEVLFQKATAGTATEAERSELMKSLDGGGLAGRVQDQFAGNAELSKAINVSAFLKEYTGESVAALSVVAEHLEKSEAGAEMFRKALATSITQIGGVVSGMGEQIKAQGDLIKSLTEQLGKTPAAAPKSVTAPPAQPLEKGFAGAAPAAEGDQLSKAQVLNVLGLMSEKGHREVGGEDIGMVTTKFNSGLGMKPAAQADVKKFIKQSAA